jgi:hypothetical protein
VEAVLFCLPSVLEPAVRFVSWVSVGHKSMKVVKTAVISAVKVEVISSRNYPIIKRVRSLHARDERDQSGLFYAEGTRFVAQAVAGHAPIEAVLYCPSLASVFGRQLIQRLKRADTPCAEVTAEVLQCVALNHDPQGISIVARQRLDFCALSGMVKSADG